MNKILVTILFILWGTTGGMAQVNYTHKLKGRVTYLSSGYKPVAGAQVEAQKGASPTRTDNDGWFSLVFYRKEAGVDVRLKVRLGKLVVVNEKELAVTLKKDQEKEIKLYMCEKKQLDKLRADYYDISIANITKRYREETERLRKADILSQEAIAKLEREKQSVIAQARKLADKFARVNFDDISDMRRKALEYFKAGDIKKAIDTLDFETLVGNIDKADEEFSRREQQEKEARELKKKAKEHKQQSIEGLLDKARLCRLDFQFDLAKKCYETAVKKDPGYYDATAALASFLYDQAQYLEARPYFERLPSLADTEEQRVAALSDLGNLYLKNNQLSEALKVYLESQKIYQQLAEKNPAAFLQYVATIQNNLGALYRANNQFPEAKHAYDEALKIRKQLAQKNPGAFLQNVANTQNNLGNLYSDNNQFPKAKHAYDEALKSYQQLAQKNPGAFLQYVAGTQNNLGNLYSDNNQFPEAKHAYDEALKIRTQLAQKNPGAFLQNVADTQNNLGILYFSQDQLEKAREILSQTIATWKQLTAKNPRAFEIDLCGTMIFLGRFVHLKLLVQKEDLTHLEKADALINDAITRLKKYPEVPRGVKLLEMAQKTREVIDKIKEELE